MGNAKCRCIHPRKAALTFAMKRRATLRPIAIAALLSPMAATCTPHHSMVAEAHQQVLKSAEERLIGFLIDGEAPPARRG